ncbi:hypothetical protein [Bradyrhizobium ganzhouense]|uniref:hypothetical protein n=1 Tax=Bradyrhizobium ganzhouense TaxID=1179767 RepID=UPI003CEC0062
MSAQTELEAVFPINSGPAVGIDLGRAQPIVLSDGGFRPTACDAGRAPAARESRQTVHRRKKGRRNGDGKTETGRAAPKPLVAAQGNRDHRQATAWSSSRT